MLELFYLRRKHILGVYLVCCLLFSASGLAQIISYSPLVNSSTLASKIINVALPVGSIAGTAGASGGATYSIPIALPPGTAGVVPGISVEYNSMSGNGLLGMGWNLSGLSSITRTNRTVYHDVTANPIELNSNDRFSMDGARLINTVGVYGANGTTYVTESETFATITSYADASVIGTGWFEVITKDGTKMQYGNSVDSRMMDANGDYAHLWRLNKIIYPTGNYIEFKYFTQSNKSKDFRISEISYTGNAAASLNPYNKIQFSYKTNRIDSKTYSDYGGTVATGPTILDDYLLDKITVLADGQTMKSYQFSYGTDNINSYLTELVESGSDGSSLNSTLFKYGDIPQGFETVNSSVVAGQSVDLFSGDFDGDGYSDILASSYAIVNSLPNHYDFKIYKRTAASSTYSLASTENLLTNSTIIGDKNIPNGYNFLARDYTGDGVDDLLTVKTTAGTSNRTLDLVRLYQFSNGASTVAHADLPIPTSYPIINSTNQFLYTGDFNGDGVEDVLTMLSATGSSFVSHLYFGNLSASFSLVDLPGTKYFSINDWPSVHQIHILDFNGDGKSDLMLIKDSNCEIFTFDNATARRIYFSSFPTKDHVLYFGDFNGDHKTDMLARASLTNNAAGWSKAISTGKNFITTTFSFSHTPSVTGLPSDDPITIADLNGDGKTDIFHGWNYFVGGVASTSRLDVYHSQGDGFYYQQYTFSSLLGFGPSIVFDLNGDGRSDLINLTNYQNPFDIFYFRKEGKENLLEKVANGVNHVTEWSYKKLTDAGSFYNRTSITPAPINTVQLSLYTVSEFKAQDGRGGTSSSQYSYADAKVNRTGKGFLGFTTITESNQTTGFKTVSTNEFSSTFLTAAPYRTQTYRTATNELLNEITMTNQWVDLSLGTGNRRNWYRLNGTTTNNTFEGRTTATSNSYDAYGNVLTNTSTVSNTYNNSTVATTTTTTTYTASITSIASLASVPNKPAQIVIAKTRTGQPTYSVTTAFAYNTIGQLTSKTDFLGQTQNIVTTYGYNGLGNLTNTNVTPNSMTVRSSSSSYDTKGRFPITTTNVLSQTSASAFDPKWSKPLSTTGIDGIITTYQYDAWGRSTQSTQQANLTDPFTITQSWGWDQSNITNGVYYNLIQHPGKPDVKVWMDVLGREIKKQTEGFGSGVWITQLQTYDSRGNIETKTQPYLPSETPVTTTTTYDVYNRVSTIVHPVTGTTTLGYSYSNGNLTLTTTNPAGQPSSKVSDASGLIVSASDNGGSLSYTYNSQGNIISVIQGANTPSTNEFDVYGRQTKLTDHNAGTTTYEYNAAGELTKETNANGQDHTMLYDPMGRVTSRTGPEGTTTYEYYPTGTASINQIKKITGFSSGNTTDYTYDTHGRLSESKETIDGLAYSTLYEYNTYGDVAKKTFPFSYVINYAYDANGFINTISSGATVIYTAGIQNGLGQPVTYSLGNSKSSTITYSAHGLPTQYATSGVQDLKLTWDYTTGNLSKRKDDSHTTSLEETFTYDNLNRLLTSTVSGVTQTIGYTADGNISSKTDAGNYSYLSTKPNAVSLVTNPNSVVSTNQQLVSYTAFLQPQTLSENTYQLTYTYGADYDRIKSVLNQNSVLQRTRYYTGPGYEKDINNATSTTRHLYYIESPAGLVAIVVREGGTDTYHYIYTDHLGSILISTNSSGTVETEQNFDAWGRRRNTTNWTYASVTSPPDWLYRGYTGHEHLNEFSLINMNGRIYDPVVGRVLSPDNFVQDPFSTQGFNRYAYGLNNPLKYTDPDGQFIHIIIGAVVGGLINGLIHIDRPGGFWKGALIGATAGALIAATGGAAAVAASTGSFAGAFSAAAVSTASSGFIGGAMMASAGTAIAGPVLGLGNKAVFGDPYSWKEYIKDVAFAGISGGITSGLFSAIGGKNFWTGKSILGTSTFSMPDKFFPDWGKKWVKTQEGWKLSSAGWKEDAISSFPSYTTDDGIIHEGGSYTIKAPTGTSSNVLPRNVRLSMFKNNLLNAPSVRNPREALDLINNTMDDIERAFSSESDRMYGILDDKYVTYHSNGDVTAVSKGHRIEIKPNGDFAIFSRTTHELFLRKYKR